MPVLEPSDNQVVELVRQLPPKRRGAIVQSLHNPHPTGEGDDDPFEPWRDLSRSLQPRARELAAQRGADRDSMPECETESLIEDIFAED